MNFFRKIDAIFSKGTRDLISKNAKNTLFRELSNKEKISTEVFDFRNIMEGNPNNNFIITCEHATNNMYYVNASEKEKTILDTHWGYDIGAKDIGLQIAEDAELFSIFTNFSRLIIDPNRSLVSNTLIREYVEKDYKLSYNQNRKLIFFIYSYLVLNSFY